MEHDELLAQFDEAMFGVYERALLEARYKASQLFQMLSDSGGLATAKKLLNSADESLGYTELWRRGRLDLTVEALIYDNPRWHPLFTQDELHKCVERLKKFE
jgi:hypothetical protein